MRMLLEHPRLALGPSLNYALCLSITHNQLEIMKMLLEDSRFNPSDYGDRALHTALRDNRPEAFCILAEDYRVDYLKWQTYVERFKKSQKKLSQRQISMFVTAVQQVLSTLQDVS